jgi:hypothetical protein
MTALTGQGSPGIDGRDLVWRCCMQGRKLLLLPGHDVFDALFSQISRSFEENFNGRQCHEVRRISLNGVIITKAGKILNQMRRKSKARGVAGMP